MTGDAKSIVFKRGRSGARYKLTYWGTRLVRIQILSEYAQAPNKPLWWRPIWDGSHNGYLIENARTWSQAGIAKADLEI